MPLSSGDILVTLFVLPVWERYPIPLSKGTQSRPKTRIDLLISPQEKDYRFISRMQNLFEKSL
jgi:hypothetical protein